MHSSLIGKVEKANRYARELDRVSIDRLSLTFRGDNDTHHVTLDAGQWHCTCHYFDSWAVCVHLLTLQKIMGVMLPEDAQVSIFSAPELAGSLIRRPTGGAFESNERPAVNPPAVQNSAHAKARMKRLRARR